MERLLSAFHFPEWNVIKSGIDDSERPAEKWGLKLTEDQNRIIRQLRKHGARPPSVLGHPGLEHRGHHPADRETYEGRNLQDSESGRARTFELISAEEELRLAI
jgi:hypothetical protein